MHYSIVNLDGKPLASFQNLDLAEEALRTSVDVDPSLRDELVLLQTTDEGDVAGPSLMYEDLPSPQRVVLVAQPWSVGIGSMAVSSFGASATVAYGYLVHGERQQDVPGLFDAPHWGETAIRSGTA